MTDMDTDYPTTIGSDAVFKGELQFEKGAKILGNFDGEVKSKGQLMVAEGADFSGEANAGDIQIEGKVRGNLHAGGKLVLASSAYIEGDIQASRLEVSEGATLIGRCTVGAKAGQAQQGGSTQPVSRPVEQKPGTPAGADQNRPQVAVAGVKK